MAERVKCRRCDAMILEVTAKVNEGLCGHCEKDHHKEKFDAVVKKWMKNLATIPGTNGIPEPKDISLRIAASQMRSRFFPTEDDLKAQYCHGVCEHAHKKWMKFGSQALTEKEKYALAVESFLGEVLNGGLEQYLFNESGCFANWSVEAFTAIGIPAYSEMMQKVRELFPDRYIPEDAVIRDELLDQINSSDLEEIEKPFWDRFNSHKGEIRAKLYDYLKKA